MYEIVAAVDKDKDRGRAIGRAIADMPLDHDEVHVTILHDFDKNPEGASVDQVGSVRRTRDILQEAGVDVDLAESSGDPADEILDLADELDAKLIVLAGRKRTPTGKVLFGSVTQNVILGTDREVMVTSGNREF